MSGLISLDFNTTDVYLLPFDTPTVRLRYSETVIDRPVIETERRPTTIGRLHINRLVLGQVTIVLKLVKES